MKGVGFHGKYGAGKDFCADIFEKACKDAKLDPVRTSFGTVLKTVCGRLLWGTPSSGKFFMTQQDKETLCVFDQELSMDTAIRWMIHDLTGILPEPEKNLSWRSQMVPRFGKTVGEMYTTLFTNLCKKIEHTHGTNMHFKDPMTRGVLLQWLGSEVIRQQIHPDTWVFCVMRVIEKAFPHQIILVTDVRFPNEIRELEKVGLVILRIEAASLTSGNRDHGHISEIACDEIVMPTLLNDRSKTQNRKLHEVFGGDPRTVRDRIATLPRQRSRFCMA